jgi:hypothetical protein
MFTIVGTAGDHGDCLARSSNDKVLPAILCLKAKPIF